MILNQTYNFIRNFGENYEILKKWIRIWGSLDEETVTAGFYITCTRNKFGIAIRFRKLYAFGPMAARAGLHQQIPDLRRLQSTHE